MPIYRSHSVGEFYIPEAFVAMIGDDAPVRAFGAADLNQTSRIFDCVRRGGIALLSGPWDRLTLLLDYADKRKSELVAGDRSQRGGSLPRRSGREWNQDRRQALMRLMVMADNGRLVDVDPERYFPYLLELTGDGAGQNRGRPFLVPLLWLRDLSAALEKSHPVQALGADIVVPEQVLAPVSNESVQLMADALSAVKDELPKATKVLDMGSGSGCLALLAADVLGPQAASIVATDLLAEAVAATKINVDRFVRAKKVAPGLITVTGGGDLFAAVGDSMFDLIIFNAPWVVSPCLSRMQRATHDEGQRTVERFLETAADHLHPQGHVLLQYSDHSGPKAMGRLEKMLQEFRWHVNREWRTRIQSRRKSPRWERVVVFDLCPGG